MLVSLLMRANLYWYAWTGVSDSIVNQLLSKIDGVNSLNNILVIGMTNRKDMIDEVRNKHKASHQ